MESLDKSSFEKIEVNSIKNIHGINTGDNVVNYYAEINGEKNGETWILTMEGGKRVTVN